MSYSSASTTKSSSPATRALPPQALTRPPAMPVGASPAAVSASVVITVVVVLPWVPDTATDRAPPIRAGQRFLPGHHRQPERARPLELRMIGRDRRRHDHRAGAFQVRGIVPLPDTRAHGGDVGRATRIGIAPAHDDASAAGDQRERTHAGPADSYEMDRATIRGGKQVHRG